MEKRKKISSSTRINELITLVPKETRAVVKEICEHTGMNKRKIQRLRKGDNARLDLTEATLLSNYLNQYLEDVRPEDLINTLPELTRKIKLKETV